MEYKPFKTKQIFYQLLNFLLWMKLILDQSYFLQAILPQEDGHFVKDN